MSAHRLFATCILLVLASTASATDQATEPASATLIDRQGQSVGTATFIEGPQGVLIHVSAKGLPPGPKGVHIHSVGTCADTDKGFVASKGHLNPDGKKHGLLNAEGPDAGDLPNVFVHADGSVEAELYTPLASLTGKSGRAQILDADGAALVIHENRDDHAAQPICGAGARIFCGVIKADVKTD